MLGGLGRRVGRGSMSIKEFETFRDINLRFRSSLCIE